MKRTRGLWASIIFVCLLVVASLVGFATGALKPTLGLDLEGGVSVILSAPEGTPTEVMEQALSNIRTRVDAFGVGEPDIVLSGVTIEVQIPGLTKGTIEERKKTQYCLVGQDETNYGCADTQAEAQEALDQLEVAPQTAEACIVDPAGDGDPLECFGTQEEAEAAKAAIVVAPKIEATPSASASPGDDAPDAAAEKFCFTSATGTQSSCFPTKKEAEAALKTLTVDVTKQTYCVVDTGADETDDATLSPSVSPSADPEASASEAASPSASSSPSPTPSGYSQLDRSGAQPLPCQLKTEAAAKEGLAAISVSQQDVQYCVISSADQNLGCFIDQTSAEEQQRATGQQRLLDVIGQTARLEERPVISAIGPGDPAFASTPVTCGTEAEQQLPKCAPEALVSEEVVYLDEAGNKYRLAPAVISGGDIANASAVLGGGTQSQVVTQWEVQFELTGDATAKFAEATTAAVSKPPPQNQIAIVVDRVIISSPTVNDPITTGSGVITGGFTETEAKDLATVLNAGALPVELTRQSVQTVSPTLGSESLRQGIVAGVAGLILLFLYLLFYYRLLGIVAWMGMSIWAILALALVSLAGVQFGYALTLAGVAGLVISLGITADSYIVFFERLKDEVRSGKTPRSAVQPAFARAYKTIVAADIVTGIAAVVLYITAVSSVRGFALTLGVATALDLFVVWFFKRPTVFLIARNDKLVGLRGFGLTSGVAGEDDRPSRAGGRAEPAGGDVS
ncbi:MAG TPA: protein translocase subunit SecD [Actinomycetota bacterium]